MTTATVDSYVNLQPVTGSSGGGGAKGAVDRHRDRRRGRRSSASLIWLVRRGRARAEEA